MKPVKHAGNGWRPYVKMFSYVDWFRVAFLADQLVDYFYVVFFSGRLLSSAWFVGSGQFCQLAFSGASLGHLSRMLRFWGSVV